MPILPEVSAQPACACSHTTTPCSYGAACTGLASRGNCPPLIVFAVLARAQDGLGVAKAA